MALEQAGVELVVKDFNKYIKELDAIDRKQREVFSFQSTDLNKSFASAAKGANKYDNELKQLNNTQKKVRTSQKQTTQSFNTFVAGAVVAATALAKFSFESAKIAASFQGQQIALDNLAASFGQSGSEIQASIQLASRGALSGLQAIGAANEALLLGVAKTPEEFDKFTRAALVLGRTVGLTASESIRRFTTALGRESLLRLDDFGVKATEVNEEIERLAQVKFGKLTTELTKAERSAAFIEAAFTITGRNVAIIGDEAAEAAASFERFAATSENLQITFGETVRPVIIDIIDLLNNAAETTQRILAFIGASAAGLGVIIKNAFDFSTTLEDTLDEAGDAAEKRFKEIARTISGVSFPENEIQGMARALDTATEAGKENESQIKALGQALKQAEQLALSFSRAQEDAAIKQGREIAKLERKQASAREKLLRKQAKEFDSFEKDRRKEITKEREQGNRDQLQEQRKLQRQLKQEQERFNLSQIQSERQFQLQETRLRAEGDILALQRLREDKDLQQSEEQENFDLSQRQAKEDGKEQQRIQAENLDARLRELQTDLEDQRAELLASFDQQLIELQISQQEQRAELQRNLAEQEADRRLSQQRQLEDLGRSFANQEAITEEGTTAIANEFEKIFGIGGSASAIISGFTTQTESEFVSLFERLEQIVARADLTPQSITPTAPRQRRGSRGRGRFSVPSFEHGTESVPGPIGQPQLAVVHGGERIIPAQQTISAPVIPSQNLNVEMSGGFNITGGEQAGQAVVEASISEMTDVLEIAVKRLARRGAANG